MDWTVYWFMLPACVAIASVAMFSGISGAALLTPLFLIGFPLLDVPTLAAVQAIALALFLETFGFGSGVVGYWRRRLPDWGLVRALLVVTVPLGVLGAILAKQAPADLLKAIYALVMFAVAVVLFLEYQRIRDRSPMAAMAGGSPEAGDAEDGGVEGPRELVASDGRRFTYFVHGVDSARGLSGAGALLAGLVSTGVGEATMPNLVGRMKLPLAVAAATSTVVVAGTVVGTALTHLVQLTIDGGLGATPWNLVVWAVPGAIVGAQIGSRLQGRIDDGHTALFFSIVFALVGAAFLAMVTVLGARFDTG